MHEIGWQKITDSAWSVARPGTPGDHTHSCLMRTWRESATHGFYRTQNSKGAFACQLAASFRVNTTQVLLRSQRARVHLRMNAHTSFSRGSRFSTRIVNAGAGEISNQNPPIRFCVRENNPERRTTLSQQSSIQTKLNWPSASCPTLPLGCCSNSNQASRRLAAAVLTAPVYPQSAPILINTASHGSHDLSRESRQHFPPDYGKRQSSLSMTSRTRCSIDCPDSI